MPPEDMHNVKLWMRQIQEELAEIALRIDQAPHAPPEQMRQVQTLQAEAETAYKAFARQGGDATTADQEQTLETFRKLHHRLGPLKRRWLP